jgi:hypothetical protein
LAQQPHRNVSEGTDRSVVGMPLAEIPSVSF